MKTPNSHPNDSVAFGRLNRTAKIQKNKKMTQIIFHVFDKGNDRINKLKENETSFFLVSLKVGDTGFIFFFFF
jgi:hypothetical protein